MYANLRISSLLLQGENNGGSMTYEEFKKELRWNVQNMETARGKTICLLERHMVCGDPMAVHIMNIMNRCMEENRS